MAVIAEAPQIPELGANVRRVCGDIGKRTCDLLSDADARSWKNRNFRIILLNIQCMNEKVPTKPLVGLPYQRRRFYHSDNIFKDF